MCVCVCVCVRGGGTNRQNRMNQVIEEPIYKYMYNNILYIQVHVYIS